ncbi:vesicular inhibitory amino acid transporter [Hoplias malabaricus]|uniref:vesicular inhibitory amino acid transporter n=1 Tax=Hoplias malabaricus TaxID=27720 RepID=UPI003462ECCF
MLLMERVRAQAQLLWTSRFCSDGEETLSLVQRDHLNQTHRKDTHTHENEDTQHTHSQGDTQHTHTHTDTEAQDTHTKITTWEAGWNVTNAIQGIFVLGLPYAVLQSGYLGLLLLVISAGLCCYSGKILVLCLYEEDASGRLHRVRDTYAEVADACWSRVCPRLGGTLVNAAQVVELMMTCVLYLVVSSNLMCHSFPILHLSAPTCSALTFLTLLPCLVITDLKVVSRLSFLCSLAHLVITLVVMGYCLWEAPRWAPGRLRLAGDFDGFLVAAGVIIFSYTSQIFLPSLEGCMANRGQFGAMMDWTHALAGFQKTTFTLLALLTWESDRLHSLKVHRSIV